MSNKAQIERPIEINGRNSQLDLFFDLSIDMFCIAGTDGYFQQINPAFEKTLGWTRETLLAKPFLEFIHPDDHASTMSEIGKLAQGKKTIHFENRFRCSDGSYKWLDWNAQPMHDGTLYAIARDVTKQHLFEQKVTNRAAELELVAQISVTLASHTDLEQILQTAVNLTKQGFKLYHTQIFLLNQVTHELYLAASSSESEHQLIANEYVSLLKNERSLIARAARAKRVVIVNDVQAHSDFLAQPLLTETRAELAIPLLVGQTVLGVLDIQSTKVNYFTETKIQITITLASQIATALQNALQHHQIQQSLHRTERLFEISQAIQKLNDFDLLLHQTADSIAQAIDAHRTMIIICDMGNKKVTHLTGGGPGNEGVEISITFDQAWGGLSGWVLREQQPLLSPKGIPDLREGEDARQHREESDLGSIIVVPLLHRGYVLGTITAINQKEDPDFVQDDVDLLMTAANQIAIALQNAQQFEQIQQSETRYRGILESIEDGYYEINLRGDFMFFNDALCRIFGFDDPEELRGTNYRQLTNEETAKKLFAAFNEAYRTRQYKDSIEYEQIRNDGDIRVIDLSVACIVDENDTVIGFRGLGRDITQRKKYEATLQEREEELQSLLEFSPEAIGVVNTQTGLFESPNANAEKLYGLSREELVKVGPADMSPAFQPNGRPSTEAALEKIGQALQGKQPVFEWMHINASGEEIPCEVRLAGLPGDRSHLVRFSVTNIIERKRIEADLQASQQSAQEFQEKLKTLHEISVELAQIDTLDNLYKQVVLLATDQLGFDRLGFFIPGRDPQKLKGTYGLAPDGTLRDENAYTVDLQGEDIWFAEVIHNKERTFVTEEADLWDTDHIAGKGWHLAVPLWADKEFLGLFFADNLRQQQPLKSYEPELLSLLSATVASLILRRRSEQALAKQTHELTMVAQVGSTITQTLDPTALLQNIIDLTQNAFNLYHAHIFLLNEQGNELILTVGAGEAGRILVSQKEAIPLQKEDSIVALVARTQKGTISNDVLSDPVYFSHPLLLDTRSEMAIPILVGKELLGVLDVQSDEKNYFSQDDVRIYSILTAQIAAALQNSRLFAESEQARVELAALTRRLTREGWQDYLETADSELTFVFGQHLAAERTEAMVLEQTIRIQGEPIGHLVLAEPQAISDEASAIIESVTASLSTHIENLRLTEQTELALSQTETLYQGSDRIVRATTVQEVLEALVESTPLRNMNRATMMFYDRPRTVDRQATMATSVAVWAQPGDEIPDIPVGTTYQMANFPGDKFFLPDQPVIFQDIWSDERIDGNFRQLYRRDKTRGLIVLPLTVGGQWLGFYMGQSANPIHLSEGEIRQIASLTEQASTVVQNLRLFEQTQVALGETEEQARRLALLNGMSTELTLAPSVEDTFQVAVKHIPEIIPASHVTLTLLVAEDKEMEIVAHHGEKLEFPLGTHVPYEGSPMEKAVEERRLIYHTSDDMGDVMNELIVPVIVGEQIIGTINMGRKNEPPFDSRDNILLVQIAAILGSIADNKRLFGQTQATLAETETLYRASAAINTAQTYDEIVAILQQFTLLGRGTANISLNYFDVPLTATTMPEWVEVLAYKSLLSPEPFSHKRYPFVAEELLETKLLNSDGPTVIEDVLTDPRISTKMRQAYIEIYNMRGTIFVPLLIGRQWVGYINANYAQPIHFSEADVRQLTLLAGQATSATQTIRLLEETQNLLQSEQRQRRLADTLVRVADRMTGLLEESEIRHIIISEINDLIRPDQISLYAWSEEHRAFQLERRILAAPGHEEDDYVLEQLISPQDRPDLWKVFHDNKPLLEATEYEGDYYREHYCLPWLAGGKIAGLVEAYHTAHHIAIRDEDQRAAEGIIQQADLRIQNARLFKQAQIRAEELTILNEMGRNLTISRDVNDVVENIYEYTNKLMNAQNFYVALYERESNEVSFPLAREAGEEIRLATRPFSQGATEYVIQTGQSLLIQDGVAQWLEMKGFEDPGAVAQSWLGVPLRIGEEVLGAIAIRSALSHLYDINHQNVLTAIAGQASIAIQNARLFAQTQQQLANLTTIQQTTSGLTAASSLERAVNALLPQVVAAVQADAASIYLIEGDHMTRVGSYPQSENEGGLIAVRLAHYPLVQEAIRTRQGISIMADDPDLPDHAKQSFKEAGITVNATIPLNTRDGVIGTLAISSRQEGRRFNRDDLSLLQTLADQATIAFERVRLLEDAQRRAQREQLLREITGRVRSSADVDTIMKTAVQEIGRAMGRETFIRLGDRDT